MYKKILCLISMFLLIVQCIIINYPIKKEKKNVAVLSKYENIYNDFYIFLYHIAYFQSLYTYSLVVS